MPILEAMACGCPVITSNSSACAEIAQDAALLVNPYSVDEIAKAMGMIVEDASLRETLRKKGIERASFFSWQKCAKEHLKVFEKVLRKKNNIGK
jgi:glycosyltransferase involved in cell wall biosynthesis